MDMFYNITDRAIGSHARGRYGRASVMDISCLLCTFGYSIHKNPFWEELWNELEKAGLDTKSFREGWALSEERWVALKADPCGVNYESNPYATASFIRYLRHLPLKKESTNLSGDPGE